MQSGFRRASSAAVRSGRDSTRRTRTAGTEYGGRQSSVPAREAATSSSSSPATRAARSRGRRRIGESRAALRRERVLSADRQMRTTASSLTAMVTVKRWDHCSSVSCIAIEPDGRDWLPLVGREDSGRFAVPGLEVGSVSIDSFLFEKPMGSLSRGSAPTRDKVNLQSSSSNVGSGCSSPFDCNVVSWFSWAGSRGPNGTSGLLLLLQETTTCISRVCSNFDSTVSKSASRSSLILRLVGDCKCPFGDHATEMQFLSY
jgi:hypothetical protein